MQYILGPWLLLPARCVIYSKVIERELDPLSFKLITYFISQPDRIIPRQELVENVWQQSFVDDNAINRAISELRKQLTHPEHKAPLIKTHYRKGYSLTVTPKKVINDAENITSHTAVTKDLATDLDITQITTNEVLDNSNYIKEKSLKAIHTESAITANTTQTQTLKTAIKFSSYQWLLILLVLLLTINIFTDFKLLNDEPNTSLAITTQTNQSDIETLQKITPVKAKNVNITAATWNIGSETHPLVSPDKNLFAYTNKNNGVSSSYIKSLSNQQEIKLTYNDLHISAMSWQPNSRILLVEATDLKSQCHYATFNLSNINNIPEPRLIKECDKQALSMAQLSIDGNTMFYIELDEKKLGQEIYQYNIKTQKSTVLVPSGDAQYGVTNMLISPNGKQLLYRWYERNSPAKLYLLDIATREQRVLYEQAEELSSVTIAWLPDGEHIGVLQGKRLSFINIHNRALNSIELPIEVYLSRMSFLDSNQLFSSEAASTQVQVAQIDNIFSKGEKKVTMLHRSDSNDYYPTYSRKQQNSHYFISSRTNQYQIWQADDSTEKQISNFSTKEQQAIYVLVLSDNEDYLLFSRNNQLEFIDLKTGVLHSIPELDQAKVSSYLWSNNDKTIIYSTIKDKVSQIWQFNLLTRENTQLTFEGGQKLLKNERGEIFYINDNTLFNLTYEQDKNTQNAFTKKITITLAQCWCSIALRDDYFYSLGDPLSLARMHILTNEVQEIALPQASMGIILKATPNKLLTTLTNERSTQVQRISWSATPLP